MVQILEVLLREGEQEYVLAKTSLRSWNRHLIAELVQSLQAKRLDRSQKLGESVYATERNEQSLCCFSLLSSLISVACVVPLFNH